MFEQLKLISRGVTTINIFLSCWKSDFRPTTSRVDQKGPYMNPKKEYEEFMHKLPERCFLIQGLLIMYES